VTGVQTCALPISRDEHEGSFAEGEETEPRDERVGSFADTDEDED